ncbi:MAG: vWA domain-containing protein [Halobacteriota archaeon]
MTEKPTTPSRRKVLAGLGTIGVASAGAGLGTTAFFSDNATFERNSLEAGELDLLLDYQHHYDGGPGRLEDIKNMGYPDAEQLDDGTYLLEEVPSSSDTQDWKDYVLSEGFCGEDAREAMVNGDEVTPIHLKDVKPGDSGCLTTSLHLCDNPAYIWMNGALVANDDNGLTEPEEAAGDDTGGEGEGELAENIDTRLWYDENCDCEFDQEGADGGDVDVLLVLDRSGSMSGSMTGMKDAAKGLVDELDSSVANVGLVSYASSASLDQELTDAHGDVNSAIDGLSAGGGTNIEDGVVTAQDELNNGTNARSGARKIMVVMSDGEATRGGDPVVAADDAKDDGIELFTVAFGSADETTLQNMASDPWDAHFFQADDEEDLIDVFSQIGQTISGERLIFEGTLEELLDILDTADGIPLDGDRETDYEEIDDNGDPDPGDGDGREPFAPEETNCIGFEWELPADAGNEVQTDSVVFDIGFYAQQARHNDGTGPAAAD